MVHGVRGNCVCYFIGKMGDYISSPQAQKSLDGGAAEDARQPQALSPEECSIAKLPVELTSKYKVLEKIGSGSFGSVYKVERLESRVLYAAKYVEVKDNTASEVTVHQWPHCVWWLVHGHMVHRWD
jgi:serine/threonine protein kinase